MNTARFKCAIYFQINHQETNAKSRVKVSRLEGLNFENLHANLFVNTDTGTHEINDITYLPFRRDFNSYKNNNTFFY